MCSIFNWYRVKSETQRLKCISFISPGDTLHLSDIDMIAGTPVLDIKPYIPEYDSPDTRMNTEAQRRDFNADQSDATHVPLNLKRSNLNPDADLDADAEFNVKRIDDEGNPLLKDNSGTDMSLTNASKVGDQLFPSSDLCSVLEDIEAFVNQENISQPCCESEYQVSKTEETKPAVTMDAPCYGEEFYTTIAGWIREPPVASLDVRFTPHAERQLAEFLPAHQSGKMIDSREKAALFGLHKGVLLC